MRRQCFLALTLLFTHVTLAAEPAWRPLFNGKDLDGWQTYLGAPDRAFDVPGLKRGEDGAYLEPIGTDRDPLGVFSVVNVDGRPALRISGQGFGYIATKESFENFHLRLQFKWGERRWPPVENAPRNNGLLYRIHSEPAAMHGVWPRCVEFQVHERDVGDLITIGSRVTSPATRPFDSNGKPRPHIYDPKGAPTTFGDGAAAGVRCIKRTDAERPRGEWNTLELICVNGESIHVVNGQVVMRLRDARRIDGDDPTPLRSGAIALQSEGAEIFYRDVELREITELPEAQEERQ